MPNVNLSIFCIHLEQNVAVMDSILISFLWYVIKMLHSLSKNIHVNNIQHSYNSIWRVLRCDGILNSIKGYLSNPYYCRELEELYLVLCPMHESTC